MTMAVPVITVKSTLTKEAKKGIEITPKLDMAIRGCIIEQRGVVVHDQGEFAVILPNHMENDEWESVDIMLITGYTSYRVPRVRETVDA